MLYFIFSTLHMRIVKVLMCFFHACCHSSPQRRGGGPSVLFFALSLVSRTVPGTLKWLSQYLLLTHCFPFSITLGWNMRKMKKWLTLPDKPFLGKMLSRPCTTPLSGAKPQTTTSVYRHLKKREPVSCKLFFCVAKRSPLSIIFHIFQEKEVLSIWQYISRCLICLL